MKPVLIVLTNWCRPHNLPLIVEAFRRQSAPVDLVCIDNSPGGLSVDLGVETWRVPRNLGPPCRFVPAAADISHDHLLFYDDDLLPGPRAVEGLLEMAKQCSGKFSTIGQIGRRFGSWANGKIPRYQRLNCPRLPRDLNPVDMTCRCHFVNRSAVLQALVFRDQLLTKYGEEMLTSVGIHDDVLLCLGSQAATGYPSYLIPHRDREFDLNVAELDDYGAINHIRPTHIAERNQLLRCARDLGWSSLWKPAWVEMLKRLDQFRVMEIPG